MERKGKLHGNVVSKLKWKWNTIWIYNCEIIVVYRLIFMQNENKHDFLLEKCEIVKFCFYLFSSIIRCLIPIRYVFELKPITLPLQTFPQMTMHNDEYVTRIHTFLGAIQIQLNALCSSNVWLSNFASGFTDGQWFYFSYVIFCKCKLTKIDGPITYSPVGIQYKLL